jgi:hypothetical protein
MDNTLRRLRLVGQQSQLRKLWRNAAHLFRFYSPFHFVCQYIYFLGFDSKNNLFPGLGKNNNADLLFMIIYSAFDYLFEYTYLLGWVKNNIAYMQPIYHF